MNTTPASDGKPPIDGTALCVGFLDVLPVDGAAIVIVGPTRLQSTIGASDAVASRMDSLQLELQEGPRWDVLSTSLPVLCANLHEASARLWPMFSKAALELGIASVFSFPVKLGNALVGTVDLYRSVPGTLHSREVNTAAYLANQIAATAVVLATQAANDSEFSEDAAAPFLRREVHQATGIVQSQLKVSTSDAFARLRAHAFVTGQPIEIVAKDVVERRLDFGTLDD